MLLSRFITQLMEHGCNPGCKQTVLRAFAAGIKEPVDRDQKVWAAFPFFAAAPTNQLTVTINTMCMSARLGTEH